MARKCKTCGKLTEEIFKCETCDTVYCSEVCLWRHEETMRNAKEELIRMLEEWRKGGNLW